VNGPGYRTVHLDELERFDDHAVTIPVRAPLGIGSFGINAYAAREAGDEVIGEHDELGAGAGHHEELYLVLTGHARFIVDGDELDGPPGTFVFVPDPATRRAATAAEPDTTVLVVGGTRGEAFMASPWDSWLEALPLYTAKDYEGATAIMARALERHPDNPNVLYNLACFEALAGRRSEALTHLVHSAELDPHVLGWASGDSDLDSIRDEPGFPTNAET
jgi:tetratricopeptide (TPR) repeat protein